MTERDYGISIICVFFLANKGGWKTWNVTINFMSASFGVASYCFFIGLLLCFYLGVLFYKPFVAGSSATLLIVQTEGTG